VKAARIDVQGRPLPPNARASIAQSGRGVNEVPAKRPLRAAAPPGRWVSTPPFCER